MIDLKETPSRKNAVRWHLAASLVLQGVMIAHAFALVPVAVSAIGAEVYGYWLASGGLLGWLGLTNFGTATITLQRCAHSYGSRDFQATRDWFAHGLVAACMSSLVVMLLLTPLVNIAPPFLGVPESDRGVLKEAITLAAVGAAVVPINDTARGFLCAVQRNGIGVTAEIFGGLCSFATAWVGLKHGWGVQTLGCGLLVRGVAALCVNGLVAWWLVRQAAPATLWEQRKFKEYLKTGTSLWSASAVGQILPQLPPLLLTKLVGPETAVAYTATTRPLMICEMFPAFAIGSLSSAISHMAGDYDARPRLNQHLAAIGAMLSLASITAAAAFCLGNSAFVRFWMGESFYLGPWFTAYAALAAIIGSQLRWVSGVNTALGSVGYTARVLAYEGIARCVLMPASVGLFGFSGIPGLSVLTNLSVLPFFSGRMPGNLTADLSRRLLLRRIAAGLVLVGAATLVSTQWYPASWPSWLLVMAAGTIAICIAGILMCPGTYGAAVWLGKQSRRASTNVESSSKSWNVMG